MTIHLTPETLAAVKLFTLGVCFVVGVRTVYQVLHLFARRRKDALFERLANEAMNSGRPVTFNYDEFKRH